MRFKIVSSLVAATALLPFLAQAEGISYSYLDAAYINTDVDQFNQTVDGFALRGSFEVTDRVFLFAGYTDQSTSIFGSDLDVQSFGAGVGYAWPVSSTLDVYGKVGYARAEADYPGLDLSDDGYSLGVGLRGRVAEQLELEGSLNYTDLSDSGDDTALGLGARWFFTPQFAVGLEGEFADDANTYGVGVRWNFGK
jgi:long-subunit fatty acid transport protein